MANGKCVVKEVCRRCNRFSLRPSLLLSVFLSPYRTQKAHLPPLARSLVTVCLLFSLFFPHYSFLLTLFSSFSSSSSLVRFLLLFWHIVFWIVRSLLFCSNNELLSHLHENTPKRYWSGSTDCTYVLSMRIARPENPSIGDMGDLIHFHDSYTTK